jgi:hypothetical protein
MTNRASALRAPVVGLSAYRALRAAAPMSVIGLPVAHDGSITTPRQSDAMGLHPPDIANIIHLMGVQKFIESPICWGYSYSHGHHLRPEQERKKHC